MTRLGTIIVQLVVTVPLVPGLPAATPRADDRVDLLTVLGLSRNADPPADVWKLAEPRSPFAWMTENHPLPSTPDLPLPTSPDSFQQLLDRLGAADETPRESYTVHPGMTIDPGRWRYKQETVGSLYRRRTKVEVPDPHEVLSPYGGRDWKAQEKLHVPVPIPVPLAEQLFVYGQFDGSGDALQRQQTALYGKTGVGLKWALVAGSEVQLRYATLLSYAELDGPGRAQPAVEIMARLPLIGPLELEYTGAAIPAMARSDTDLFKQELRFAYPLRGENEVEFGARYRWEYTPTPSPWHDRAELFFGVKLRH